MFLIKLGGSVITEKSHEQPLFKKKVVYDIASVIQRSGSDVVIVHGAGSFGHVLAKQYDLMNGCGSSIQKQGFARTHLLVQQLNTYVLSSFQDQELPVVSIPPHATVILNNHDIERFDKEIFSRYRNNGFIPMTFGDVVLDTSLGCSICSGDVLIRVLAETFQPESVIFLMDEDGLYTANPKKDKNATFIKDITIDELHTLTTKVDDHADVTKGMQGKLEMITKIVQQGSNVFLLNGNKPDRLYDVLQGKQTICTTIHG
jgi:isopentenyl phosphate kinase